MVLGDAFVSAFAPVLNPLGAFVHDRLSLHRHLTAKECNMVLGTSMVSWGSLALYIYRKYSKRFGDEYPSRIVSGAHAVASCILSGLACLDGQAVDPTWGTFGVTGTGLQQAACLFSAAYFTVDTIGILSSSYFSWLFLGHHFICASCLYYVAYTGHEGFELTLIVSLMELSNPFLHGRWLLMEHGAHKLVKEEALLRGEKKGEDATSDQTTAAKGPQDAAQKSTKKSHAAFLRRAYRVLDTGFYITFVAMRIVVGPLLTTTLLLCENAFWLLKVCGSLLQIYSVKYLFDTIQTNRRGEEWR